MTSRKEYIVKEKQDQIVTLLYGDLKWSTEKKLKFTPELDKTRCEAVIKLDIE